MIVQESHDPGLKAILVRLADLALPDYHYLPATLSQLSLRPFISGRVALHLGDPVVASRRRHSASAAIVHVPKTPIDVDDLPQSWEHKIRRAGKGADMQAVAVSQGMDEPADHQFRGRVL
jgi:hypothetical protein